MSDGRCWTSAAQRLGCTLAAAVTIAASFGCSAREEVGAAPSPATSSTLPAPPSAMDATARELERACAALQGERPLDAAELIVRARHCQRPPSSALELRTLLLQAQSTEQATALLGTIAPRSHDTEVAVIVAILAEDARAREDARPLPPRPDEVHLLPLDARVVEQFAVWRDWTRDPSADRATKIRAHAALAAGYLQLLDSLGVRGRGDLPPLGRILAARFLTHADAFARAHLRVRVAGLHPTLLRLEPEMADVFRRLSAGSLTGVEASVAIAWDSARRYLEIGEVRRRLATRQASPHTGDWLTMVRRCAELGVDEAAARWLRRGVPGLRPEVARAWILARRSRAEPHHVPADAPPIPEALARLQATEAQELKDTIDELERRLLEAEARGGLDSLISRARARQAANARPELAVPLSRRLRSRPEFEDLQRELADLSAG